MIKKEGLREFFSGKRKKALIFLINFILIYGILITAVLPEKYSLKEGDIAKIDIKAPRDVEDQLSTKEKKKEAIMSVPDQYTIDSDVKNASKKNIDSIFSKVMEKKSLVKDSKSNTEEDMKESEKNKKEVMNNLKGEIGIDINDSELNTLIKSTPKEMENLKDIITKTLNKLYDEYQINAITPKEVSEKLNEIELYDNNKDKSSNTKKPYDKINTQKQKIRDDDRKKAIYFIDVELSKYDLNRAERNVSKTITSSQIRANVFYDEEKTRSLKQDALTKVESIKIKKDQTIVKEGEPVTKYQVELLRELGFLDDKSNFQWYIFLGLALLIALILLIQGVYLFKYHKDSYEKDKMLILVSIINILSIILARSLNFITPYLIPLAFAPMILTLLINYKLATTISILNGIFLSIAVKFNPPVVILIMLNAVICSICIKKMDERSDILYSSLYIAIINSLATFSLGVLQSNNNILDSLYKSSAMLIASILSGIFTIGFLPVFESVFDVVTTIKLLELANPNNPLLKRLLTEAPGTYHHSMLVANLSELAAEAIGANSVFARVACYYHDVGKLKRPYFFRENQMGGINPHDKIGPTLSTLIITSHVKDGVELAKEYKIPKAIQDIIIQHHGSSLVKYFYITMKNSTDKPEDVLEDDFRYQGADPLSKEAGIIMLADGVEAAVRSIKEPNKEKIEKMVDSIIKARLDSGHLDNSDLTLRDLKDIKEAFLKGLSGIYHERIEYPKLSNMVKGKNNKK
ncbi:HD family phosphohydrolase [Hathewaya histolytica]|uniref:HD family phosphohydrolase n=1 Tax=Hathewaya histolytica TaxID=1498 RepID=UPI003B679972